MPVDTTVTFVFHDGNAQIRLFEPEVDWMARATMETPGVHDSHCTAEAETRYGPRTYCGSAPGDVWDFTFTEIGNYHLENPLLTAYHQPEDGSPRFKSGLILPYGIDVYDPATSEVPQGRDPFPFPTECERSPWDRSCIGHATYEDLIHDYDVLRDPVASPCPLGHETFFIAQTQEDLDAFWGPNCYPGRRLAVDFSNETAVIYAHREVGEHEGDYLVNIEGAIRQDDGSAIVEILVTAESAPCSVFHEASRRPSQAVAMEKIPVDATFNVTVVPCQN